MTLRKGQKLIAYILMNGKKNNYVRDLVVVIYEKGKEAQLNLPDVFASNVLFNMRDEEFDRILKLSDEEAVQL